ncbi:methyl-accepting chemotaxis protein [Cohnella pontilimi]|uniref:Methyl-accepting chemotaxis protein n=1 Tax=Cohnella pontilimi TaxID=2564100 RepID=A0A4U0FCW9_9BACL|nr:methyl-accepting chemotaxis protein [Cohnella pontilimi]TJY42600.1 methyl-accepting chemotaxis protein [Cohnella pontilimi]
MIKMTVKNRLVFAFLAILILPCSAIGWFSYQKAKNEVTHAIMDNASQTVQFTNNQINELISRSFYDMDYLAKKLNVNMIQGDTSPAIKQILDQYKALHPEYEIVYFGTKNKQMFFSPDQKIDGYDPTTRPWFTNAVQNTGKAVVSDPMLSQVSGNITVNPSKTTDDGSGVVGGSLDLGKLAEQVNRIKVGKQGYASIMDKDRKYIAHPTQKAGDVNGEAFMDNFYKTDTGTVDYTFQGKSKRSVFVTNELTGWKIIATIEMSEIAGATQGILYTTLTVIALAIFVGTALIYLIIRSITTPLQNLMYATEKIASGDLTEEIEIRSNDELAQLARSVNNMMNKLRELIAGVVHSSQNVAAASQQISATTEEMASGSTTQASAAQNIQELFAELSSAINAVAKSAEEASDLAAKTSATAYQGGQIVNKSVESMDQVNAQMTQLEEDSGKIGEIIEVINDIAEQTNLLALNAAIEAARAGEQGRGFAVVAEEVRKLAERSGEATKQITEIITGMQKNTHRSVLAVTEGVSHTKETGQAFEQIMRMIKQMEQKVTEIAAASEEQAAQSNEVMHSVESISSASQEAAAASEETAATSQSLAQLAEGLHHSVSVFKVK